MKEYKELWILGAILAVGALGCWWVGPAEVLDHIDALRDWWAPRVVVIER